jgi:hypothetical protein
MLGKRKIDDEKVVVGDGGWVRKRVESWNVDDDGGSKEEREPLMGYR